MSLKVCVQTAHISYDRCSEWGEQRYRECDNYRRECCDWWPCNWGCEIASWFCSAWVWLSKIVCFVWETFTLLICLIWEIIEIVLAPLAALIDFIKAIPVLGRFIGWVINFVTSLAWRLARLPEMILSLIGIEPVLTVRLNVLVIRFNDSYPQIIDTSDPSMISTIPIDHSFIERKIEEANEIWMEAANINIVLDRSVFLSENAPQEAAFPSCADGTSTAEDLGLAGTYYQQAAARNLPLSSLGRTLGLAGGIIVIMPIDVIDAQGCALGPFNDYLTVDVQSGRFVLAHEIGHKLALGHHGPSTNLMTADSITDSRIEWWQRIWARNSKYASQV